MSRPIIAIVAIAISAMPAQAGSMVDLSSEGSNVPVRAYPPPAGAYSPKLYQRGVQMFPWASQSEQRERWMAEQEQRDIANGINAAAPLIFPAR
jgi:hypothetical protein